MATKFILESGIEAIQRGDEERAEDAEGGRITFSFIKVCSASSGCSSIFSALKALELNSHA